MKATIWPTCMAAGLDEHAAKPERGDDAEVERQHHERHRHGHGADGAQRLLLEGVVGLAEALVLMGGAHKGLDHAHAGQVFLHDDVERVEPLLHAAERAERPGGSRRP